MIDLPTLIAAVESDGNQYAMRFEPVVYGNYVSQENLKIVIAANRCSMNTARVIRAVSWGRYQIMGFNLYGVLAVTRPVGEWMASLELQDASFARFCDLNHCHLEAAELMDDAKLLRFARIYNGPGAPDAYAARLKTARARLEAAG